MAVETEIKLELDEPSRLHALSSFECVTPRQFEDNTLFDKDQQLASKSQVMRLRRYGDSWTLTFKGPAKLNRQGIKKRTEHECEVSDGQAARAILEGLGFAPSFRYQKYRTTYRARNTLIMVDETPIGLYVELEGPEDEISEWIRALKWSDLKTVRESYVHLYLKRRGPDDPPDMVFSS
ncbi:MAG: class IV adenylate cyclase [Acidobacteria bacterium]|nr:class IV adenylate cyclase [Acidobacteriota bacterium]